MINNLSKLSLWYAWITLFDNLKQISCKITAFIQQCRDSSISNFLYFCEESNIFTTVVELFSFSYKHVTSLWNRYGFKPNCVLRKLSLFLSMSLFEVGFCFFYFLSPYFSFLWTSQSHKYSINADVIIYLSCVKCFSWLLSVSFCNNGDCNNRGLRCVNVAAVTLFFFIEILMGTVELSVFNVAILVF